MELTIGVNKEEKGEDNSMDIRRREFKKKFFLFYLFIIFRENGFGGGVRLMGIPVGKNVGFHAVCHLFWFKVFPKGHHNPVSNGMSQMDYRAA